MNPDSLHVPSRRERLRDATVLEIVEAARQQLTEHGPQDLSLRAVARKVGLTPSALYRYFQSRAALIDALVADSTDSVVAAMNDGVRAQPPVADQRELARRQLVALRVWALARPSEFELVFASPAVAGMPGATWSALPLREPLLRLAEERHKAAGAAEVESIALSLGLACLGWLYAEHFGLCVAEDGQGAFEAHLDQVLA